MCLGGGGSPKVEAPKPSPLPPPIPAPPPPKPAPEPKKVQPVDAKPDIRVGAAKSSVSSRSTRSASRESRGNQSLSIGNNQGMKL
mgnify:CR=1 FL=1